MQQGKRLFFALWPDEQIRRQLGAAFEHRACSGARRVPECNLHLTLAYMGRSSAEQERCFIAAGDAISGETFELVLDQVHWFKRARVGVVSPSTHFPSALSRLHQQLNQTLAATCGFEPETRPFHPHITLLRKVSTGFSAESIVPVVWQVKELALLESCSEPSGVLYKPVRRWALE